jgi:hypothetical protein
VADSVEGLHLTIRTSDDDDGFFPRFFSTASEYFVAHQTAMTPEY